MIRDGYGVSLDISVDNLHGLGIHGHRAGDEDKSASDDGLGVDAGERLGRT